MVIWSVQLTELLDVCRHLQWTAMMSEAEKIRPKFKIFLYQTTSQPTAALRHAE